jgi:small GTP-binding protein
METILSTDQEELLRRTRDTLNRLRDTLAEADAPAGDRAALADSIRQLDELFLLVIAGEFNAGKSAFINALLGLPLLQEGVTPTTSQIHLLQYGPEDSREPREKGIWQHTAPIEILKTINIVDTPGTNAILREHEALTAEFIPRSDLVLFLTSTDRPFTESERAFLTRIREWGKKIVLVVNKTDLLENETELDSVVEFVTSSAHKLVGDIAAVFPVSARLAQQAKAGAPRLWEPSGFEPLENYIQETLDDAGRFQLKLLNPLGVGHTLVKKQIADTDQEMTGLEEDAQLLNDIQQQTMIYDEDMQRNFRARLSELDNILYEMEDRGDAFFDEMLRLGRIPDLIRAEKVQRAFEEEVVADVPEQIEARVGELVDWMVEQELRQWTAVGDHLARRQAAHEQRIVGQTSSRQGTLAYDRQRLIDSIGRATREAVAGYDKEVEAAKMAEDARMAVAGTALAEIGGLGLGAIIAALGVGAFDVTGIVAGVTIMTVGLLILPARRRRAKQELAKKLATLRQDLMQSLTNQFEREMRRSSQRVEDTVAPFSRFVRAERTKIEARQNQLAELEAHILGLQRQLEI